MKNILIILTLALFSLNSFAQDNEFAKMMREMYKQEFVDVVNENMNLPDDKDALFQPLFAEFLDDLRPVLDAKLKTQKKFADYFEGMTDEQAQTLISEVFANRKAYDKLQQNFEKKLGKSIGYTNAFRFFLIMEKVMSNFEYTTIQTLPLVQN